MKIPTPFLIGLPLGIILGHCWDRLKKARHKQHMTDQLLILAAQVSALRGESLQPLRDCIIPLENIVQRAEQFDQEIAKLLANYKSAHSSAPESSSSLNSASQDSSDHSPTPSPADEEDPPAAPASHS